MEVQVHFLPNDVTVTAKAGDPLLEVAREAGIIIPTGCLMGSCHACEVELDDGTPLCACIAGVPATEKVTIHLFSDPVW